MQGIPRRSTRIHEYRLTITKASSRAMQNEFVAYSIVTKESKTGLSSQQRLFLLDSASRELRYYGVEELPLPIMEAEEVKAGAKALIRLKETKKFQFNPSKSEVGKVTIVWVDQEGEGEWVLQMTSNQIVNEWNALIHQVKKGVHLKEKKTVYPVSKYQPLRASVVRQIDFSTDKHTPTQDKGRNLPPTAIMPQKDKQGENKKQQKQKNIKIQQVSKQLQQIPFEKVIIEAGGLQKDINNANSKGDDLLIAKVRQSQLQKRVQYQIGQRKQSRNQIIKNIFSHTVDYPPIKISHKEESRVDINVISKADKPSQSWFTRWLTQDKTIVYSQFIKACESTIQQLLPRMQQMVKTNQLTKYQSNGIVYSFIFPTSNNLLERVLRRRENVDAMCGEIDSYRKVRSKMVVPLSCVIEYLCITFMCKAVTPKCTQIRINPTLQYNISITRGVWYKMIFDQKEYIYVDQLQCIPSGMSVEYNKEQIKSVQDDIVPKIVQGMASVVTPTQLKRLLHSNGISMQYLPMISTRCNSYVVESQMYTVAAYALIADKYHFAILQRKNQGYLRDILYEVCTKIIIKDKQCLKQIQQIYQFIWKIPLKQYQLQYVLQSLFNRIGIRCTSPTSFPLSNHKCISSLTINYTLLRRKYYNIPLNDQSITLTNGSEQQPFYYTLLDYYDRDVFHQHLAETCDWTPQQRSFLTTVYSSLTCNQITYLNTKNQFTTHLLGIKRYILSNMHEVAEALLSKQETMLQMWYPSDHIMHMQLYDLQSMRNLKRKSLNAALAYSLMSMQRAFDCYAHHGDKLLLAEKTYQAAEMHYSVGQYQRAMQLYDDMEMIVREDGENMRSLVGVAARKAEIHLAFAQFPLCLDQCLRCLGMCATLGSQSKQEVQDQKEEYWKIELHIYEILMRCYEVTARKKEILGVANICCKKFISKQHHIQCFVRICKMVWTAVATNIGVVRQGKYPFDGLISKINAQQIKACIKLIRDTNSNQYRYTKNQIHQFFLNCLAKGQSQSTLMSIVVNCLERVSNNKALQWSKPYKLISEDALQNEQMLLQGICTVMGYDFAEGLISGKVGKYIQ